MKTPEQRAQIARDNGAKSKGPTTAAGKEQSKRNAITHGERAAALKLLVPPHSALLLYEDRREFYKLFDTNIAKYRPADDHENAVVREITDLQWSNARARLALHALLNRELIRTGAAVQPLTPDNFAIENIIAAYDSVNASATVKNFHKEYAVNTRLIAALERRLAFVQRHWPGKSTVLPTTAEERSYYNAEEPAPDEGTQPEDPKTAEKPQTTTKKRVKILNVRGPLTPEKIRTYHAVFPNRELKFNIIDAPPAKDTGKEPKMPIPKAA